MPAPLDLLCAGEPMQRNLPCRRLPRWMARVCERRYLGSSEACVGRAISRDPQWWAVRGATPVPSSPRSIHHRRSSSTPLDLARTSSEPSRGDDRRPEPWGLVLTLVLTFGPEPWGLVFTFASANMTAPGASKASPWPPRPCRRRWLSRTSPTSHWTRPGITVTECAVSY
jgi:hypothetical protein